MFLFSLQSFRAGLPVFDGSVQYSLGSGPSELRLGRIRAHQGGGWRVPRALIVTDRNPVPGVDPGFERRVVSIREWLERDGFEVDLLPLCEASTVGPSRRAIRSFTQRRMVADHMEHYDLSVISALNAPHMILMASRLALNQALIVDICDSTTSTRRAARGTLARAKSSLCAIQLKYSGRIRTVSYVTDRDLGHDSALNVSRTALVVGQEVPRELLSINEFAGPPERVVIPADLSSEHNRLAFCWLVRLIKSGDLSPRVPIEIYGPVAPDDANLPGCMTYRGWAPALSDVYAGRTAVFAPNVEGVGLQNKVWEAYCAGRPVLVGAQAAGSLRSEPGVLSFWGLDDLAVKFAELEEFNVSLPYRAASSADAIRASTVLGRLTADRGSHN